jgi:hypothetical protein
MIAAGNIRPQSVYGISNFINATGEKRAVTL